MHLARWLRRPIVWLPVSIGLMALLAWRSGVLQGDSIAGVDARPLAAAALLSSVVPLVWAIRSAGLLAAAGRPVGIRSLIPMTAFANTINNLTPGSAGEVLRLYLLRAHHEVDFVSGGAVILERLGSFGYLATSALLAWLSWIGALPLILAVVTMIAIAASPGIAYRLGARPVAAIGMLPIGRLIGGARWVAAGSSLQSLDGTIARLVGRPRGLLAFALACAVIFAITASQLILVGRTVGVTIEPLAAWGALGLATLAGVASLLPFGLGATDLTLAALLGVAGVPPLQAAAMAFGYRLVSTVPLGLAGVASYAYLSASLPDSAEVAALRESRTEAAERPVGFGGP